MGALASPLCIHACLFLFYTLISNDLRSTGNIPARYPSPIHLCKYALTFIYGKLIHIRNRKQTSLNNSFNIEVSRTSKSQSFDLCNPILRSDKLWNGFGLNFWAVKQPQRGLMNLYIHYLYDIYVLTAL